jgi:hypothetical protein
VKRDDDLVEYVTSLEQTATKSKAKLDQRWIGQFAVPTTLDRDGVMDAFRSATPRWTLDIYDIREGVWVIIDAEYHAKGANADDAVQLAEKLFGVAPGDVRVRTVDVVLVGSKPDTAANNPAALVV